MKARFQVSALLLGQQWDLQAKQCRIVGSACWQRCIVAGLVCHESHCGQCRHLINLILQNYVYTGNGLEIIKKSDGVVDICVKTP